MLCRFTQRTPSATEPASSAGRSARRAACSAITSGAPTVPATTDAATAVEAIMAWCAIAPTGTGCLSSTHDITRRSEVERPTTPIRAPHTTTPPTATSSAQSAIPRTSLWPVRRLMRGGCLPPASSSSSPASAADSAQSGARAALLLRPPRMPRVRTSTGSHTMEPSGRWVTRVAIGCSTTSLSANSPSAARLLLLLLSVAAATT
mmetsp:Transcript_16195/g.40326  ORF Transcript_16195/g.40326 Transcript_16195/m.40326 type:complete len:205 (+) Transcript_16195:2551-3165(+)